MKKLAPIIVTIVVSGYIIIYIGLFFFSSEEVEGFEKILLGALGVGAVIMLVLMIYTLIIRLKEIDKEDDDDLSKY